MKKIIASLLITIGFCTPVLPMDFFKNRSEKKTQEKEHKLMVLGTLANTLNEFWENQKRSHIPQVIQQDFFDVDNTTETIQNKFHVLLTDLFPQIADEKPENIRELRNKLVKGAIFEPITKVRNNIRVKLTAKTEEDPTDPQGLFIVYTLTPF